MFLRCSSCRKHKHVSQFYKHNKYSRGFRYSCKECDIARVKKSYRTSKKAFLTNAYNGISSRIKSHYAYKQRKLNFSKKEFLNFAFSDMTFNKLWENWIKSGYQHKQTPTVDRINNDLHYDIDNIQFLTISDNAKKLFIDKPNQNCKPVYCLTTGISYKSAQEASKHTGIHWKYISAVCIGNQKSTFGTKWQFA